MSGLALENSTAVSGSGSKLAGIKDKLTQMPVGQKIIASILAMLLVGGALLAATTLTRPTMSPLFTGLSSSDASAVVEQLKSNGVAYELTDGGTTVLVPDEAVYNERLTAAAAGIPSAGGTGYALLDDVGITSSEFQQDTSYKRAIEGELAATIGQMDGVEQASVKLAIPEETVFADQKQNPTASVFVQAPKGLTAAQVQAVVHLTSASVEGMNAEDVAVVDSAGKVLSAVGQGMTQIGGGESELTAQLTSNVQGVLDDLVGPGNSTVAATVATSRTSTETVSEEFAAPEGEVAPLTETTENEDYTGSGNRAGTGVLGPDNVANTDAEGAGAAGEYSGEKASRTNPVNKTTTSTNTPAGDVQRQTVAVAVDEAAAGGLTTGQLTTLVVNAAGLDLERGDSLNVEIVPFTNTGAAEAQAALEAAAAAEAAAERDRLIRDAIIAGIVGAVVLIGFVAWMILRRRRTEVPLQDLGETAPTALEYTGPSTGELTVIPAPETVTISEITEAPTEPRELTAADRVRQAAAADPERTAAMMRSLMEKKELA